MTRRRPRGYCAFCFRRMRADEVPGACPVRDSGDAIEADAWTCVRKPFVRRQLCLFGREVMKGASA